MGLFRWLPLILLLWPVVCGGKEDAFRVFKCANGGQVQAAWMCDGEDDCGDRSDETAPECLSALPCSDDQFRCRDNGRCISLSMKCDREPDCGDKSDEDPAECQTTVCQPGHFKCDDHECVPESWICDGTVDCKNGLDEASCNRTCTSGEFSCADGQCISKDWKCDSDIDCTDGSDERGCQRSQCSSDRDFTCGDGHCMPKQFVCDGDFDCLDRSDELNCTNGQYAHGLKVCRENEFECPDRKTCIHKTWLCDVDWDCPDGADESPEYCSNICSPGMFQCANKQCVPGKAQCDGVVDCNDGSDERNCSRQGRPFCSMHEFDCGSGLCLSMDKACNGVAECSNQADESPLCGINECTVANGGCDHNCIDEPIGFRCTCNEGYQLEGNSSCVDVDECHTKYGSCSHVCTNSKGSFSCSCRQGYAIDPEDRTRCRAEVKNAFLLITKREDIRKQSLDNINEPMSIIVNDTKLSVGLDFNYNAQEIYWSDTTESVIYKADVEGLTPKKVVVEKGIKKVECLAVDWIHGNIYWTDTGKKTIEVSTISGSHKKTLISTDLEEPRALVIDPHEGWMFWSDWGKNAKIVRAGLDGSNRQSIITRSVRWPNGLSLDYESRRLFWVDAKMSTIFSSNYDGTVRRLVLKSPEHLHHPYSIAVFEDRVYWSDWDTQTVYKADKFDGRGLDTVGGKTRTLQDPMVLQVYHPYRQPRGEDVCSSIACSHLCLPKPKLRGGVAASPPAVCACPDGMELVGGTLTCSLTITPAPASTAPSDATHPPVRLPPIYIDFVPPEDPSLAEQAKEINWLLVLVIILAGSFFTTFVLVSACACVYKIYLHGNFKIMNFDNPIYHKTPTQDPLCSVESSEPSAPGTPVEEARQPFCV